MIDPQKIRRLFPILKNPNLIYLDAAASAQKPQMVIDAVANFLKTKYSNIHRGAHFLGDAATDDFEKARGKIAKFFGAGSPREMVFGKNATEMINLIANTFDFRAGDKILLTRAEHHANLIPWLIAAKKHDLKIHFLEIDKNREILLDEKKFRGAKIVAFPHISNVLGVENPAAKICALARKAGAISLVDACQSAPHLPIDVAAMGCDFLVASIHKMYGPSGVGVLFGRKDLLKKMPPFLGGGEMIRAVSFSDFTPNEIPHRFEAGTPPIENVVGAGAAIDFLENLKMSEIEKYGAEISRFAFEKLSEIPEIKIVSGKNANGLVSFSCREKQNYDLSDFLSDRGICVRVGHHCAEPLHELLGVKTTVRASFAVHTEKREIEILATEIKNFFAEK